ncbi:kinase [Rhodococcus sp. D2-41]|uniref:Kinase n=1 Tax=Speluncibacter jeojiensis TaxID=2710754 RepID=A0A9X4RI81_9ACTN|nr:kinase [Rhodococcus sp. D2-41]MDG3011287.1 kinase [Rhodococcus sp. D2-41]MDG3015861.1 kinase [Corynebacteriales bacterium D3-21]
MTAILTETISDHGEHPVSDVVAAAERLLTRRTGATVTLVDPVDLGGSGAATVVRVRVAENPFSLPRTLVLKQVLDASGDLDQAFRREAVSYQFANSLTADTRPGPELIAHDLDERLLVLTDLGDAPAMGELLANKDEAEVTHSLMAMAQALGRMHAATFGREDDFAALMRRAGGTHAADPMAEQVHAAIEQVPGLLGELLGVTPSEAVVGLVTEAQHLFGAGGYRAFSPADLCPDNILVNGSGVRFLDYEFGGFRDATLDIAYALVPFPGCLCTIDLNRDQALSMIEAWRAEVVGIWSQLRDDSALYARILEAQLIWVWLSTYLYLPDDEIRMTIAGQHELASPRGAALRQRWQGLAEFAETLGVTEIADHAREVAAALANGI